MNGFPERMRHGTGVMMSLDSSRLLLAFAEPQAAPELEKQLAEIGLILEDTADQDEKIPSRPMAVVNHTEQRFWVRSIRGQVIDERQYQLLEEMFGDGLAWIGPVYRMPNQRGRAGLLCPLPHVLLVKIRPAREPRGDVVAAALTERMAVETEQGPLREVTEKSKYLGDFRYYEVTNPRKHTAYELRDIILEESGDQILDVRFENMPLLVPTAVVPNDTLFAQQWNMPQIQAPDGWDITTGSAGVVVSVLDTGCDLTHPDLQYSDPGINLGTMMPDGSPTGSHGTACAGIVAGTFDNNAGVAGVAGSCQILPLAVQTWSDTEIAAGINYAADNGAQVISMSFGNNGWDPTIIDPAIQHAFDTDVVMCVATHNYDGPITYPATNPLVMACGASDQIDNRKSPTSPDGETWWGSDYGPEMSVVAPGVLIPTTDRQGSAGYDGGDYVDDFNGTSSATPHVAGLAGLLRTLYPGLSNVEVRNIIERSAEKVGVVPYAETPGYPNGTWNEEMGYGRINVFRALDLADAMIRDYPADSGEEPSTPPGGNFWSFSDIVVRIFDDDVFMPGDPAQSKHLELGQTNYLYVRVKNNGPRAARNVVVTARITPFVGTQFVYPHDWTAVDATHISPTPVTASFASIPAGGEEIAKFTISAAQVQVLWDENWHPCLVASVNADNDYAFDTAAFTDSPIVVRRNNLAQRNLSVINVLADTAAFFPFLAGHRLNLERAMEIMVNRRALPAAMPLHLALDEGNQHFPEVDVALTDLTLVDDECRSGIEFLERTRIKTRLGCCEGVLTLAKGSRFDCPPQNRVGRVSVKGGEVIVRDGRRLVEIREDVAVIRMEKAPSQIVPLTLHTRTPADAQSGEQYMVSVAQRDEKQQIVGGASAVFMIEA